MKLFINQKLQKHLYKKCHSTPYNDGNGRMARALAHYCLAGKSIEPFSISSIIYANKKDYYEILEQTTKLENNLNFDFTAWIKWHLEAVNSAIKQAISSLKR
jgi:filamentation induced by cAMP protein fic